MARVLIFTLVFPPDGVSTAQLMGELAEDLVKGGHEVSVVTTQPHFNRDEAAEAAQPRRPVWGGLLMESEFRGIPVLHTAMPARRRTLGDRLQGWISFHVLGFLAALHRIPAPDVVVVPSPLLTAGLVAWAINRVRGGCYIYNVQELYPDIAVEMGRLRSPWVLGVFRRLERFVYRHAAAVTGISQGICDRIVERRGATAGVHRIPNFVDLSDLTPLPKDNPFARKWKLQDRFVVSYAGNMGYAQGLETILEAAEHCEDDRIRFVMVGGGVLHGYLSGEVQKRQLTNVTLLDHQPYTEMPEVYGASDVCLVPLLGNISGSALPSKVFRIMACGRPVLALCDPESEMATVVRDAGAGIVVPAGRWDLLLDAVHTLLARDALRVDLGRNGRSFVERNYSRDAVTGEYVRLVTALAGRT